VISAIGLNVPPPGFAIAGIIIGLIAAVYAAFTLFFFSVPPETGEPLPGNSPAA
jgi:hypothetical protein